MLIPVQELVFLHTMGVELNIHKSQFDDFAKAMFNENLFAVRTGWLDVLKPMDPTGLAPLVPLVFNRILDARTTAKYIWHTYDTEPRCYKAFTKHRDFDSFETNKSITSRIAAKNEISKRLQAGISYRMKAHYEQSLKDIIINGSSVSMVIYDDKFT